MDTLLVMWPPNFDRSPYLMTLCRTPTGYLWRPAIKHQLCSLGMPGISLHSTAQ